MTTPAVQAAHPPRAPYRVVNAVMRRLLTRPRPPHGLAEQLMVLHVTGRTSGRTLDIPVARHRTADGQTVVLTSARWRTNLRGGAPVEVTLDGLRRPATAELVEQPDVVAGVYSELIERHGWQRAGRRLGIRLGVRRAPTLDELADAARRDGLSVIRVELDR